MPRRPRRPGAPAALMLRAGVAALRASPLRTALSAIGVVIGVGAMVSVLALSDGVERAFRERMAADGRLVTVRVAPRTTDVVDGQAFARRETVAFTPADARALAARLGDTADVHLLASTPGLVAAVAPGTAGTPPAPRGVVLRGVLRPPPGAARRGLAAGRFFTGAEAAGRARVLVVDYALAARLLADRGRLTAGALPGGAALTRLLAEPVWVSAAAWRVVGVLAPDADDTATVRAVDRASDGAPAPRFGALVPFAALDDAAPTEIPSVAPNLVPHAPPAPLGGAPPAEFRLVAQRVEDVGRVRELAAAWLASRFGAAPPGPAGADLGWRARAELASYEREGEEAGKAVRVFRLLMGAITGVSLVVGGVGIMNVLLASVSERTREIGVARAVGARARDVGLQFLAESVAIAGAGAVVGTALGVAVAFGVAAVMRGQAGVAVRAGLSAETVLVAAAAPLVVGVVFGIYPALRAARLSPIDAIRHE